MQSQFDQFPGLGMTVHGLITNGQQLAVHFSEHGASGGVEGKVACWWGVAFLLLQGSGRGVSGGFEAANSAFACAKVTTGRGFGTRRLSPA